MAERVKGGADVASFIEIQAIRVVSDSEARICHDGILHAGGTCALHPGGECRPSYPDRKNIVATTEGNTSVVTRIGVDR